MIALIQVTQGAPPIVNVRLKPGLIVPWSLVFEALGLRLEE
jgi:hypothetical protein